MELIDQELEAVPHKAAESWIDSIGKVITTSSDYARKLVLIRWFHAVKARLGDLDEIPMDQKNHFTSLFKRLWPRHE